MGDSDPIRIVYIAGWGRSGSTVLGGLLGNLPGAAYIGELWNLWEDAFMRDEHCGCRKRYSECEHWQGVLSAAGIDTETGKRFYRTKAERLGTRALLRGRPELTGDLLDYAQRQEAVYRELASRLDADTLVDSSKTPNMLYVLSAMPGIDLRVVHMVRDPRAVAYSWYHRAKKRGPDGQSGRMARHSPLRSTTGWLGRNVFIERATRQLGLKLALLRYEDFADDPEGSLHTITNALGLPHAPLAELAQPGPVVHSVRGNPVRFEQPGEVAIRRDDAWMSQMPLRENLFVSALAMPFLGRYSYPLMARR